MPVWAYGSRDGETSSVVGRWWSAVGRRLLVVGRRSLVVVSGAMAEKNSCKGLDSASYRKDNVGDL